MDNASTDATAEVVTEFSRLVDCPVHYVCEPLPGHSIALNTGCRMARGEKLIFTDDDTLPATTWFNSIHQVFTTQNADWVFGPVIPRWEFGPAPAWFGPETSMFIACLHLGNQTLVDHEITQCFVGANHACRRDRIFQLGLYNPNLGIRGDGLSYAGNDDDLFLRGREAGFSMVYCPTATVEHLIAKHRYEKATHREMFRMTGRNEFQKMLRSPPPFPCWFRIPRYYYSYLLQNLVRYVCAWLGRNRPQAFYHETQILRFGTLIWHGVKNSIGFGQRLERQGTSVEQQ